MLSSVSRKPLKSGRSAGLPRSLGPGMAAALIAFGLTLAVTVPAAETRPASGKRTVRCDRPPPPWKALRDYPRPPAPDTGWGIHDDPNCYWKAADLDAFFRELRQRYGFCWFKVLACGQNKLDVVEAARRQGLEPVVRLYVERPAPHYPRPGRETEELYETVKAYVAAGARYFEVGNEPNLELEWSPGEWEKGDLTERVCEQWLRARVVVDRAGGIPVFYAMSVGGNDGRSAGQWWDDCFATFQRKGQIEQAFAGAAFGVHLGPLNRPVDYPFNPERNLPHATPEERIASLMQDNTTYLACELLIALMDKYLPCPIPILSTEGGAFPDNHDDKNYPPVTPERHRELNLEILRRFNPEHPRYWGDAMFAQMSWIYHTDSGPFAIDSWFNNPKYGDMPILEALAGEPRFDRGVVFKKRRPPASPNR